MLEEFEKSSEICFFLLVFCLACFLGSSKSRRNDSYCLL